MIRVLYTPTFVRQYKKLDAGLREEIEARIALFCDDPWQPTLKFHKLKGKLKGFFSFSVNYSYRILVEEDAKGVYALLAVGDHDVYK